MKKVIFTTIATLILSGCSSLTGIRTVDMWGFKMDFAEGADFHIGSNVIDKVEDKRGVNPVMSYQQGKGQKY